MRKTDRTAHCLVLREKNEHVSAYGRQYRFDLGTIRCQPLRRQLRRYILENYKNGTKALTTLRQEYSNLHYYEQWLLERGKSSLLQISRADAEGFPAYLSLIWSKKSGQPLRRITQKHIYDTVRSVYYWYACRNAKYDRLYGYFPTDVYPRIASEVRTLSAPCGQAERLLRALVHCENPCLQNGMLVLLSTGIAPSDVLALRTDALQYRPQGMFLHYYHHRKRCYRTIPVSAVCARAIEAQCAKTAELRAAAGDCGQRLFLYRTRDRRVAPPSADMFRYWLRGLAAQNRLPEEACAQVTCTAFRYLLTQELAAQQIPDFVIQELTGCHAAERRLPVCV